MAHRLKPISGPFLAPNEIVRRLGIEFDSLDASAEQGQEHVRDMLTYVLTLKAAGTVPVDENYLAHLQSAESQSVALFIADDPYSDTAYLQTCAMPDEPLFFGYCSPQHEDAARPLLERCARALQYEIELL